MAVVILSLNAYAQDEKLIKDMIDRNKKDQEILPERNFNVIVQSPFYELDIDENSQNEYIFFEKKDNEDWVHITNQNKEKIFSGYFIPKGSGSGVYKVRRTKVSDSLYVLLLYYYEGYTTYFQFQGTSRLYVITTDKKNTSVLSMSRGPILFEEKKDIRQHYHQRNYDIKVEDLDKDGTSEINVRYHKMSRILKYQGKGQWYLLEHGPKIYYDPVTL